MNRLLLDERDRLEKKLFRVTGRRAEHIRKVLHAGPGDLLRAGIFGGRLGEYKYYDMDQTVAAALRLCKREL